MTTPEPDTTAHIPQPRSPLPRPVRRFLETESAGGLVLLAAAVVAVVWANSPWRASYSALWETPVALRLGPVAIVEDLGHFVEHGLMTLFFLVVGLEIKREIVGGELRSVRAAALPVIAAAGGMIVPALIFAVFTVGTPGAAGWPIPMATDIAFAVGVLALLGPRVPPALKVFLLTLAVADDVGAIVVIVLFLSHGLVLAPLLLAAAFVVVYRLLFTIRVSSPLPYALAAVAAWYAISKSGVHPTIAGVAIGLATPARAAVAADVVAEWGVLLSEDPSAEQLQRMRGIASAGLSPTERIERRLHVFTSFVVMPLFAAAAAGVSLTRATLADPIGRRVVAGVVLGLVVGKMLGIVLFSWLSTRLRVARLPEAVGWGHVTGVAALAGIGFTVSLFVSGLAFEDESLQNAARVGIFGGSLVAAGIGLVSLRRTFRKA